ncbi:uncharacterized protein [Apostichopus japonicus]|uniref:uncharacterized protein n=1 Tax=Stichopus japonicus TaxID=307972 RepID=UPI003AB5E220
MYTACKCHEGDSIDRGHYKAVVKDDRRNNWLLTDDSEVSPTSESYALFGCKQEACAVGYRQVHSVEFHSKTMLEESDLQQRVSTKAVDLQEQFPAVLKYLEEIMNETILSERHKNFITGKRERKGYLFGARLVSIELKNTLHNMLDAHFKTKKTLTQGPVDHRLYSI